MVPCPIEGDMDFRLVSRGHEAYRLLGSSSEVRGDLSDTALPSLPREVRLLREAHELTCPRTSDGC